MMKPEDVPTGVPVIKDRDGKFWFQSDIFFTVGTQIKLPMGDGWIVEYESSQATMKVGWWTGNKWKEQAFPRALVEAWKKSPPS